MLNKQVLTNATTKANAGSVSSVTWMKAHTDAEQCTTDQEMQDWVGNFWADKKAKEAARMYRYEKEQLEAYVDKASGLMATAAAMAARQAAWPGLRELYRLPLREPTVGQRAGHVAGGGPAKAHEWKEAHAGIEQRRPERGCRDCVGILQFEERLLGLRPRSRATAKSAVQVLVSADPDYDKCSRRIGSLATLDWASAAAAARR